MIRHVQHYWLLYWSIGATIFYFWWRSGFTYNPKEFLRAVRSSLRGQHYLDPKSRSYRPDFIMREARVVVVGCVLIAIALTVAWFLGE